jgi:hypothetical protein
MFAGLQYRAGECTGQSRVFGQRNFDGLAPHLNRRASKSYSRAGGAARLSHPTVAAAKAWFHPSIFHDNSDISERRRYSKK